MFFNVGPLDSRVGFEKWKDQVFPAGSRARARFEYLCVRGCDAQLLHIFLAQATLEALKKRTIYDVYGVPQSALSKLPDRLERISSELESVNRIFGDYIRANFVENSQCPDRVRLAWRQQAAVYRTTPALLRLLAGHLRAANKWIRNTAGPRRFDTFRKSILELLKYVDNCTKSPHYDDVSELLDHLFSLYSRTFKIFLNLSPRQERTGSRKKKSDTPLLSSPDALKALYHHSVKYGFREPQPKTSKLARA